MSYILPQYITSAELNNPVIGYTWYDPNPGKRFNDEHIEIGNHFVDVMEPTSLRAKIALMIGIHEWVLGRFQGLTHKELPYQMAEASWCANINVDYAPYFECDVKEFSGPIDRALFYSVVCLHNVIFVSNNIYDLDDLDDEEKDPEYLYSGDEWEVNLRDMIALVLHILPTDKIEYFKSWLDNVVSRLLQLYTLPELNPLDNLFGQDNNQSLLGEYVPREVLDLNFYFEKKLTIPLINNYMLTVDKKNPLLSSLDEISKKIPEPYKIR